MPYEPNLFRDTLLLYEAIKGTYWINGKPTCMRYKHHDKSRYCQQPAGWRTAHPGQGACHLHDRSAMMGSYPKPGFTPNKTNRYQRVLPKRMQAEYDRLYNDPDLLDLTPELTLLKTMLTSFLQGCDEEALEETEKIAFAAGLANSIGKMIGQIEKIQSSQVLTFSTARLMMAKAVDVASHYIPQEQMKQFIADWKAAQQMPGLLEGTDDYNQEMGEEQE